MVGAVDFWGSAVPAWVGAIGGVFSAVVAAWALVSSLRAQGGVRSLQRGLNDEPRQAEHYEDSLKLGGEGRLTATGEAVPEEASSAGPAVPPARLERVRWSYERVGEEYRLVNASATQTATVTRMVVLTATGEVDADVPVPRQVAPGDSVLLKRPRTLAGPMVIALRIEWTDGSAGNSSFTLYI
jgi:hypothetical protein